MTAHIDLDELVRDVERTCEAADHWASESRADSEMYRRALDGVRALAKRIRELDAREEELTRDYVRLQKHAFELGKLLGARQP